MSESLVPSDGEVTTTARAERWEADESIITINGAPTGNTLSGANAFVVARWLNEGGLKELAARLSPPREGAGTTQRETELARRDAEECLTRMVEIAREALAGNEFYTDRPALWISTMEAHATVIRDALDYLAATPSSESRP